MQISPRPQWRDLRTEASSIRIVLGDSAGREWKEVACLRDLYSPVPWIHDGKLYLFVSRNSKEFRNDGLLLMRSEDRGRTWTQPVTLFAGHFWNSNTGMVVQNGTLYWATDDISRGLIDRGTRTVACDLTKDPMDPRSWRMSEPLWYPPISETLVNPAFAKEPSQCIEPNVISLHGKLRILLATKPGRQTTAGLAAVVDLKDEAGKLSEQFVQYNPMLGAQIKFYVLWDEKSGLFWAVVNPAADSQSMYPWWPQAVRKERVIGLGGNDRRFLMLMYSQDGLNWFQAGCIAQAPRLSQSFMYAIPAIDGDDLVLISRSSIAAANQHDADCITFHRVRDFRNLAMDLTPQPEPEP